MVNFCLIDENNYKIHCETLIMPKRYMITYFGLGRAIIRIFETLLCYVIYLVIHVFFYTELLIGFFSAALKWWFSDVSFFLLLYRVDLLNFSLF